LRDCACAWRCYDFDYTFGGGGYTRCPFLRSDQSHRPFLGPSFCAVQQKPPKQTMTQKLLHWMDFLWTTTNEKSSSAPQNND
jgi:hypothetical protein